MITNTITKEEFERMLKPILRLEPTERIFETIYPLFHLPPGKRPFDIDSENQGIATTYKSFALDIKYINWVETDSSEHPRLILSFTKAKTFLDDFVSPTRDIVNDLKKSSMSQIPGLQSLPCCRWLEWETNIYVSYIKKGPTIRIGRNVNIGYHR